MVATTDIADEGRVDGLIEGVLLEVRELPRVAEEWEGMDERERSAVADDWDLVVMADYLRAVEKRHRRGLLSASEEDSYRRLKEELKASLPTIERLGLYPPPVELCPASSK